VPVASLTPAERFAITLRCLTLAVVTRGAFGLSPRLIGLIVDRIRGIKQCFARIAARVAAGTYQPRRFAPRRPPAIRQPRPPNRLPRSFGWLQPLVPEAVQFRAQLEHLLRDPEMAALLAAAPASLARPLRSLCRMLRVDPPAILAPILAPPPAAEKSRPAPPPAAENTRPPPAPAAARSPPRPQPPAWMARRTRWTLTRIRGPAKPA
jgi:hypothetical protein